MGEERVFRFPLECRSTTRPTPSTSSKKLALLNEHENGQPEESVGRWRLKNKIKQSLQQRTTV